MSFQLPSKHGDAHATLSWTGMALIVEAMVLLLFLVASLSIITQVFFAAAARGQEGYELAEAVAAATNVAERFAADPRSAEGSTKQGSMLVSCEVNNEPTATGTLYHATIQVRVDERGKPVYELTTARFEREVG